MARVCVVRVYMCVLVAHTCGQYPNAAADAKLENIRGLSVETATTIIRALRERAEQLLGAPMLFDLTSVRSYVEMS